MNMNENKTKLKEIVEDLKKDYVYSKHKKNYFFRLKKCTIAPISEALRQKGYEVVAAIV